jgi:LemA protein
MEPIVAVLGVVALLVLIPLVWWVATYNRLVRARNAVRQAWGTIDAQLQQRYDLLPDVVAACRSYCKHEQELFDNVLAKRQQVLGGHTSPEDPTHKDMDAAIQRLFALAESYPALRAVEAFTNAQNIETGIEKDLAASRRWYNAGVADYNSAVESFPACLVARTHGFQTQVVFAAAEQAHSKPVVWG